MSNDTNPAPLVDTYPAPLISNAGPMFERGDQVRHMKSMRLYRILLAPPNALLEATGMPVYAYFLEGGPDPRIWVRPMAEMEDGRFVLHRKYRILDTPR